MAGTRRRLGIKILVLVIVGLSPMGPTAFAAEGAGTDQVDSLMARYDLHPAFEKLGRGVSNFLGGWMEIPLNVGKKWSATNTGGSFFTGLAVGVFKGVVRTGVGLYETVTFLLPVPDNFAPILPTLEYYNKTGRHDRLPLE